jgi:23S rRNA-/tRNA-specific pseudouridylate synthase
VSRLYKKNRDLSQRLERVDLRVDRPDEGRFDLFLARHLPWRSRTGVRELIDEGKALLNGERRKASTKVRAGDRVVVEVVRENAGTLSEAEVSILFEDDWMLALDKASGVVVHPVGPHQEGTLLQALHRRSHGGVLPTLIHRIDQYTSGVLLVAKSDSVRAEFSDMLERGEVDKEYDALLLGRMEDESHRRGGRLAHPHAGGFRRGQAREDARGGRRAVPPRNLGAHRDLHRPHAPDPGALRECGASAAGRSSLRRRLAGL